MVTSSACRRGSHREPSRTHNLAAVTLPDSDDFVSQADHWKSWMCTPKIEVGDCDQRHQITSSVRRRRTDTVREIDGCSVGAAPYGAGWRLGEGEPVRGHGWMVG